MSDTEPIAVIKENTLTDESLYNELLTRSGGQFTGDEKAIKELLPIYKKLNTLAARIGNAYKMVSEQYGLQPGKIEVVLGGGRAKGKPFNEGSDLDIFFHIENQSQNLDLVPFAKYPSNAIDAVDEKNIKMQSLQKRLGDICREESIPNHFHIMGWGVAIPGKYRLQDQLLLARVE